VWFNKAIDNTSAVLPVLQCYSATVLQCYNRSRRYVARARYDILRRRDSASAAAPARASRARGGRCAAPTRATRCVLPRPQQVDSRSAGIRDPAGACDRGAVRARPLGARAAPPMLVWPSRPAASAALPARCAPRALGCGGLQSGSPTPPRFRLLAPAAALDAARAAAQVCVQ
jgi:hypothetical protein